MAGKKNRTGIVVFIIIIALSAALAALNIADAIMHPAPKAKFHRVLRNEGSSWNLGSGIKKIRGGKGGIEHSGAYIARLFIDGVIEDSNSTYNQEWLLETIEELKNDDDNLGIILFIDSPGGGVYEADEAYLKLLEYKKEKPLYAYMGPIAASGGYYIACAADYIMANRNTLTGSIGVISGQTMDLTGLMESLGIKSETIHAGANKNMGGFNEPLSQEQRQILQSIADECYEQFTDIVAKSRSMEKSKVYDLADGRIYTARQAQENGLIDSIGSWSDVVSQMQSKGLDWADAEVVDVKYEPERSLYRVLWGMARGAGNSAESTRMLPEAVEKAVTPRAPYPAYIYDAGR